MIRNLDAERTDSESRLDEFLLFFRGQTEAALLIAEDEKEEKAVIRELKRRELPESLGWTEVLQRLASNQSTFIVLRDPLGKEGYDILAQLQARNGIVQTIDRRSLELTTVTFDKYWAHLLLVTTEQALQKIEVSFGVQNKVGLIERFEKGTYGYEC